MSKKKYYLGIDLGGTNTKLGLVDSKGKIVKSSSVPTFEKEGPDAWQKRVIDEVKKWNMPVAAVGVASPGPLDVKSGTILETPNLKSFKGFAMARGFKKYFKAECHFENDANAAALAERHFGKSKKARDFVVLTLGTGVGSGVIANGALVSGHQGYASELGHMVINFEGPKCFCGRNGCLEAYVGARNLLQRYHERGGTKSKSVEEIFENIQVDSIAKELFQEWTHALSLGLVNIVTIFNPEKIVLSGGLTASWSKIWPELTPLLSSMISKDILQSTKIEISGLGKFFGVLGATASLIVKE